MYRRQSHNSTVSRWSLVLGLLCVLLVVLAGTLNVTHGHEQDNVTHADCGLCAAAHVTVQLATVTEMVAVAPVHTRVEAYLPAVRPRILSRFALFIRPPPVRAHLAA